MQDNNTVPDNVLRDLPVPSKITIIPHQNPDGDALGSALGLYHLLLAMGHKPRVVSPNSFPAFLRWMPGADDILIFRDKPRIGKRLIREANLIFLVDFNRADRIPLVSRYVLEATCPRILIDHHPEPEAIAGHIFSDTTVSSTSELILETGVTLGYSGFMNLDAAKCLFTGIMTDTGCFSFNSSRPQTWKAVASLLEYGIDKDQIHAMVFDNFSEHRMKLLGFCLQEKMVILHKYQTGFISLNRDELLRFNFQDGDSEGFVNYPLSIGEVYFSALFIEKSDHIKISFRSKGVFPANRFASEFFFGGGHHNAAGGRSFQSLEETILRFVSLLADYSPVQSRFQ